VETFGVDETAQHADVEPRKLMNEYCKRLVETFGVDKTAQHTDVEPQ